MKHSWWKPFRWGEDPVVYYHELLAAYEPFPSKPSWVRGERRRVPAATPLDQQMTGERDGLPPHLPEIREALGDLVYQDSAYGRGRFEPTIRKSPAIERRVS